MSNLNIDFKIENIGPHKNLDFNGKVSSLKTAIYANNGSGKTFISRLFRLLDDLSISKANKLLSFTESRGLFEFKISDGSIEKKFGISLIKNDIPNISTPLPFIFHTFNSDYVHENIEALKYKPDGDIEGYILGKAQIDLSKEKQELKTKENELVDKEQLLKDNIKVQKEELDKKEFSIRKNIAEYTNFTFENIFSKKGLGYVESKTFNELKKDNTTLNTLPDDLADVSFSIFKADISFVNQMKTLLVTNFSKSNFAEEFKVKVKSKQAFVKDGLSFTDKQKSNCPFCEQTLSNEALTLIDRYTKYLEDEEAKTISQIDSFIRAIDELKKQLSINYTSSIKTKSEFDNLKKYLPSFASINLQELKDIEDIKVIFNEIQSVLTDKKDDITKSLYIDTQLGLIEQHILNNEGLVEENKAKIAAINKRKNNLNSEKLEIKKKLCKTHYLETLKSVEVAINEISKMRDEVEKLKVEIGTKENLEKVARKEKVIETFEDFLNIFFNGKYTFDKDNFCLKFDTHNLIDNASDVLSDGEKNIVAFCFYLAETHRKISKEADYKKVFFIIDDPISSLDFHYVYSVAQIIRRLNDKFPIGDRLRCIVLTHNIEFMSILVRNKIVDGRFILENSEIKKLQKELIMPYEEHLRDVYEVSKNIKIPNHTTPNSIRHILETINKFEKPNLDFRTYCEYIEILKDDNEFLYALIHDNSHGNYRMERAFTADMIIKGCEKTIEVILSKFDGQIKVMEKEIYTQESIRHEN